jgi:chromosome partitioning protein
MSCAFHVLLGERKLTDQIIKTECENVSLIPSEFDLCAAEVELARLSFETTKEKDNKNSDHHLTWLKEALKPISKTKKYDIVLIDCPPSLGKLTLSVLIASQMLLIPLQCEYYPLEGISSITDLMNQLKESGINKKLELIGVLIPDSLSWFIKSVIELIPSKG